MRHANVRAVIIRTAVACAALALLAGATGCGSSERVLTLTQQPDPVKLVTVDANQAGHAGDVYVFEGPVLKDGRVFGAMVGTLTRLGPGLPDWHSEREERLITAVFDLEDGEISIEGVSYYAPDAKLRMDQPEVRAVVGGTGAYIGARGEVTTTHNADGSYTHVIRLL